MKCSKCGYIIGGATIDACFCEDKVDLQDLKLTFKREPMNERFEIGPVKPTPFKEQTTPGYYKDYKGFVHKFETVNLTGIADATPIFGADYDKDLSTPLMGAIESDFVVDAEESTDDHLRTFKVIVGKRKYKDDETFTTEFQIKRRLALSRKLAVRSIPIMDQYDAHSIFSVYDGVIVAHKHRLELSEDEKEFISQFGSLTFGYAGL